MTEPIAIVGVGAILPDAPDARAFWNNLEAGRYSIGDVPPDRWDPDLYYDPDPKAPERTYSRLGGWVREWAWSPIGWGLPIPPRVTDAMDDAQKWAIACTRAALTDYGWPGRPIDGERTAVIVGNAMAGEKHYQTSLRIAYPEVFRHLAESPSFASLPADLRDAIAADLRVRFDSLAPAITEDTMPGELGNCIAGRVANLFDLHGPNFVVDAACASALAALAASIAGLSAGEFDLAVTGGVDRNMGAATYVKFCKIGALSATGTRPFDEGADGFVMGEGAALFVLKRLADAERDGDHIYAVVRGVAAASDGRGKGITAPNPAGQRLAVARAWRDAGLSPATCSLVEAHGTSTRVGDVVEVSSIAEVFASADLAPGEVPLGSVKSNIGHLKAAAGAAGLLKVALALDAKRIPPSLGFRNPNPNIDWPAVPFHVVTELTEWKVPPGRVRCAGLSAFGFGGTNFHAVLEEHVPGRLRPDGPPGSRRSIAVPETRARVREGVREHALEGKAPLRGAVVVGAPSEAELAYQLREVRDAAAAGRAPEPEPPSPAALAAPQRVAIDFGEAGELAEKATKALAAIDQGDMAWRLLQGKGVFRGSGPPGKVAFLYTGQGSQYDNMLAGLRVREPAVAAVFDEADEVMGPLLGRRLSDIIFVDGASKAAVTEAEEQLRRTEITQPAVLAVDVALTRLLAEYGVTPQMVMGHSLGEYGALVAAGCLSFAEALEAVSARGREMASLTIDDPGLMVAVSGPLETVEEIVESVAGNVVVANVNSTTQSVIGGATAAVEAAELACRAKGLSTTRLRVSHAFHTAIVAPASEPLRQMLQRLHLRPPPIPIVSNVTGDFYPGGPDALPQMIDLLARQVASPVQFVRGLRRLASAGAQVFVEVGPKWVLRGFVTDVFGDDLAASRIIGLATNHPKVGDVVSFNQALCGLYAAGVGQPAEAEAPSADTYRELGRLFAEFLERGRAIYEGANRNQSGPTVAEPVVITGAALGTPGTPRIFDDGNLARLLNGEQFIDVIPARIRHEMLEHRITRLVKSDDGASFETIDSPNDVIRLAARGGEFDLAAEFGIDAERVAAFGRTTQLAIAAGFDALRDAGIPLTMHYRTTRLGSKLPERWGLPDELRDDTGVIFASAFPGIEEFAREAHAFATDQTRRDERAELLSIRARLEDQPGTAVALAEIDRRLHDLDKLIEDDPYRFNRRFLFRVLSMGHSQFADLIGARGPNTQLNAACASTTQAVGLAGDWIGAGRCRRVVVIAADDVTSDEMLGWFGSGFLATGAAATDDNVADAALPFDRRRHGMILGMGAAALVVEAAAAARERGLRPICEVLGAVTANSAFHGTRLDVEHIGDVMEQLVSGAEERSGIDRHAIAPGMVFVSHETYTPARGGSASAEIAALRRVFGADAVRIVIANTKGFTGHPMAVGLEDVVAVKTLETGIVPPVANHREPDPQLGSLNLSKGGAYPVDYALRLAAGFGSQIAMLLLRWVPPADGRRRAPDELGFGYRLFDQGRFEEWLAGLAGEGPATVEVVNRQLRLAAGAAVAAPVVEATAVAIEAPAAVEARAPQPAGDGEVAARIVGLVAEQTGYPADMLALDLDLEADLGIDTVKQAELFAAIRGEYGIERDESLRLRDYPTLAHVVAFVQERAQPEQPAGATEAAAAAVEARAPQPAADGDVAARIVGLVAEQTGYPADMLALDLDLEADLGIDTVKQAELFAAIRGEYGIERDESLRLRDYPTLAHVVAFVQERAHPEEPPVTAALPAPAGIDMPTTAAVDDERFPRRVPFPVLRPALERCRATGVTLDGDSRVVVVADAGGAGTALAARLVAFGVDTLVIDDRPPADELVARLAAWRGDGPVTGVYWLPALDVEDSISQLTPEEWSEGTRCRVKLLAAAMRELYADIVAANTFLLSGTRLGGWHGYDPSGALAPMGGAVTGFTKAFGRERPDAVVKAVDFALDADPQMIADHLLAETTKDPGTVEVGYADGRRWSIALAEEPSPAGTTVPALGPDRVVVVSGAAGSIVSAIIADLAREGGTFHLLDLIPAPDPGDPDVARFESDRDGLKRELAKRLEATGERPTPAIIERQLARIERAKAAADAISAVTRAGGTVHWHQVDLTSSEAVDAVMRDIRSHTSRIDVLVHAAGVEASHLLDAKPTAEFDLVFDVKATGFFNLLHGLEDHPLDQVVVFSSVAGRFGNAGQTDYSAANDQLCKIIASFRSSRPATRGTAIDWTAWAAIGMASRGSIPKLMEAAGIEMLPVETGVPVVRRELGAGGPGGEVVVAGCLGTMSAEPGGPGSIEAADTDPGAAVGPLVGRLATWTIGGGLMIHTELDPIRQNFLRHHRIDGTAVLPGAMGIEAFAEAAVAAAPGMVPVSVEDIWFLAPLKFFRDATRMIELSVQPRLDGTGIVAECALSAGRVLADGTEQRTTHFTGVVRLGGQEPAPRTADPCRAAPDGRVVSREAIYRVFFHGPAYQVVDMAWCCGDQMVGRLAPDLPPNHEPTGAPLLVQPRLIELCFQTAAVQKLASSGQLALPHHVRRIEVFPVPDPIGPWHAVVKPGADGRGVDAVVVDDIGNVRLALEGYETIALPGSVAAGLLQSFQAAIA